MFCGAFGWPFKVLFGTQGRPPPFLANNNKKNDDGYRAIENDIENPKERLANVLGDCETKIRNARVKHAQMTADAVKRREAAKVELKKGTSSGKANAHRLMSDSVKLAQEAESLQVVIGTTTDMCAQLEHAATRDDLMSVFAVLNVAHQSLQKKDPAAFRNTIIDTKTTAAALTSQAEELTAAMHDLQKDQAYSAAPVSVGEVPVTLKDRAEEEMKALEEEILREKGQAPVALLEQKPYTPAPPPAFTAAPPQSRYPPVPKDVVIQKARQAVQLV